MSGVCVYWGNANAGRAGDDRKTRPANRQGVPL